ncbi:hypothetical protein EGC79_04960 [Shewanella vesiculosa]|nr:hypothetical protein EGC79_04960 [Shewanella vesiculosa]
MLRGGWEFQEGTAVSFLLVWCGRSATTLVAAGHKYKSTKVQSKTNTWIPAQKHYRDDEKTVNKIIPRYT